MAQKFKNQIDAQEGIKITNELYDGSNAAGTSGQVLSSTGTGTQWIDSSSSTAERIEVTVKNVSGGSLSKGTVVHAAPSATPPSGNVIEVIAADYDTASAMPAIGVLNETIANEAEGAAVMMGAVSGIDTDSFNIGDELYVGNAGTFTNSKPTANNQLIQKMAVVIKKHASNGLIKVFGAGRSNDVPNLVDRTINFADNAQLRIGDGSDLRLVHDGTDSFINSNGSGDLYIQQFNNDKDIIFKSDDGSGGVATYITIDGSDVITKIHKNFRYLDNVKANFGNSDDLQIYHDGSNSYIKDTGTGSLIIEGDTSTQIKGGTYVILRSLAGENMLIGNANGSVDLYYDASKKFETTSSGIDVTGDIIAKNTGGAGLNLRRDDTTISGTNALGYIGFAGDDPIDGTFNYGSLIRGRANGSWGASSYPGELEFQTRNTSGSLITALTLNKDQSATFAGDVTVTGDLIVSGSETILNTETVQVEDNIIQLNRTPGSPDTATAATSGITIYRGNGVTEASFIFDDADDTWDLTNNLVVAGGDLQIGSFGNNNAEFALGQTIANKVFNYGAEIQTTNSSIQLVLGRNNGTSVDGTGGIGANSTNAFHVYDTTSIVQLFQVAQTSGNATFHGDITVNGGDVTAQRFNNSTGNVLDTDGTNNYIKGGNAGSNILYGYFSQFIVTGDINPQTDSTYDLGSTSLRWANVWADNINGGTPVNGSGSSGQVTVWSDADTITGYTRFKVYDSGAQIQITDGTRDLRINSGFAGTDAVIGTVGSHDFSIMTANTKRLTISSGGTANFAGDINFDRASTRKIIFNSDTNFGGDKAFLYFNENSSFHRTGTENVRFSIGAFNDFSNSGTHSDAVDVQGGSRLYFNTGDWDTELDSAIGTPSTGVYLDSYPIQFAINNDQKIRIGSGGDLNVKSATYSNYLNIGTYTSNHINSSTLPDVPSEHMINIAPPSTTNYYGGGISWSEGTNTAASLGVFDDGGSGALGFYVATGNNGGLTMAFKIDSTKNARLYGPLRITTSNLDGVIEGYDENHAIVLRENNSNSTSYYQYGGTLASGLGHKFYTGGTKANQNLRLQIADDGATFTGDVTAGTTSTSKKFRAYHSDGTYVDVHGYGLFMSRGSSYIRPVNDNTQNMFFGYDAGGNSWNNINFEFSTYADFKVAANRVLRVESSGLNVTGNILANVTNNGTIKAQYDSNNFAHIQANSSGGVFSADAGGTTNILLRSYGDSYFNGGDLGVGTQSPDKKLHIVGDQLIYGNLFLQSTSGSFRAIGMNTSDGADNQSLYLCGGGAASGARGAVIGIKGNEANGHLNLIAGRASGAYINFLTGTSSTEKMKIDADGRVFINSGHSWIETFIDKGLRIKGSRAGTVLESSGTLATHVMIAGSNSSTAVHINHNNSGALSWYQYSAGKETFRLHQDGKVGIGGVSSPLSEVHIKGSSGVVGFGNSILTIEDDASNYSGILFKGITNYNAAIRSEGGTGISFWQNGGTGTSWVQRMQLDSSGHLNIWNASSTTAKYIGITNTSGTTGWTFGNGVTANAHQFVIYDNSAGQQRLTIDSSGKLGIGILPDQRLHVDSGATAINQGIPATSGTSQNGILRLTPGDLTYGETLDFGMNVGPTYAWIQATNKDGLNTNYSLALNPNGGNIGIGLTAGISQKLTVNGSMSMPNAQSIYFAGPTDINWRIGRNIHSYTNQVVSGNSLDFIAHAESGQGISFGANNATQASLEIQHNANNVHQMFFNGIVQVDTTRTDTALNINGHITGVSGNGYTTIFHNDPYHGICFRGYPTAYNSTTMTAADAMSLMEYSGDFRFYQKKSDGTLAMRGRLNNGTWTVTQDIVAFGSPSDVRLKENIKPIENALDKVDKLNGVTFDWKENEDDLTNIKHDYGLIAQDVEKVIPELVRTKDDGMKSLRYQGITPILLEAIKELKAEIEELKKCNCK